MYSGKERGLSPQPTDENSPVITPKALRGTTLNADSIPVSDNEINKGKESQSNFTISEDNIANEKANRAVNPQNTQKRTTPAGTIYDIVQLAKASGQSGAQTENAKARAISKLAQSVMGQLALTTLGVFGSLAGLIRIGLPDDDKGDSDYASKRRAYSLEIFGHSISIGWTAPCTNVSPTPSAPKA
jgi:hypothetical protein